MQASTAKSRITAYTSAKSFFFSQSISAATTGNRYRCRGKIRRVKRSRRRQKIAKVAWQIQYLRESSSYS